MLAPRALAQHKTMAGPLRRDRVAIAHFDRLLDQMIVVLERVFEPVDLGQGGGKMHADLEHRVAEAHRDAVLGRQPTRPHDVGDVAVDVEDVDAARLDQPPLAAQVQIFAGVDMHPGRAGPDLAQAVEIVPMQGSSTQRMSNPARR